MSDSVSRVAGPPLLAEVRDLIARRFGEAMVERIPQAVELLEQQLAATQQREQWKPLRGAVAMLSAGRATLAADIAREVAKRFDARLAPGDDVFGKTARFSLDKLSLVADDEVREEIAIGNAAKRLHEQLGEELFTLTQRLASLMYVDSLSDDRNPAFPRILARGLYDALCALEADASARLAAFAAFGPAMLDAVGGVYRAANGLLISRGVLPDFKRTYAVPSHAVTPTSAASARGSQLDRLLAAAAAQGGAAAAPGMVTIQVRPELLSALRTLEARLPAMTSAEMERSGAFPPSAEVRRAKRAMAGTLTPSDAVVADIVAALFDRLFAEPRLCDAAKAQVGRLQLPVLKAILKDHSFFDQPAHPIRHLIDTIAELGTCDPAVLVDDCTPEEWIAAAVQNIIDGGEDDEQLYEREVERLAGALERHHEATLAADPQVQALRERETEFAARREASLAIAHRVDAAQAPREAATFLYDCWRDVMVHDYTASGDASEEWTQDLKLLDDLLAVLVPHADAAERSRLAATLPTLVFRMKIAYLRAGLEPGASAERLERLRRMIEEVSRAPASVVHAAGGEVAPAARVVDDYTATLHSSISADMGMARGSWFEFREADGAARRYRLTWMSPVQGVCVFKDLERNRSFAIGLAELAERRRVGSALQVEGPGVAAASVDAAVTEVTRSLEG